MQRNLRLIEHNERFAIFSLREKSGQMNEHLKMSIRHTRRLNRLVKRFLDEASIHGFWSGLFNNQVLECWEALPHKLQDHVISVIKGPSIMQIPQNRPQVTT